MSVDKVQLGEVRSGMELYQAEVAYSCNSFILLTIVWVTSLSRPQGLYMDILKNNNTNVYMIFRIYDFGKSGTMSFEVEEDFLQIVSIFSFIR